MNTVETYQEIQQTSENLKKTQKKPVPNSLQPLLQVPTTSKNHFKQRFTYRVAGNTSRVTKPINKQATQHI